MDHREWLKQPGVFVVEMSDQALANMIEDPEREMPKDFGDACDYAAAEAVRSEDEAIVVIRVKYERRE